MIVVCCEAGDDLELRCRAEALAEKLGLVMIGCVEESEGELLLVVMKERLELRVVGGSDETIIGGRGVFAELGGIDTSSRGGRSLKQPLIRAVGIKKRSGGMPVVIDATAGFGEDAWLLASFGCRVLAIERSGVMAEMLDDALRRASDVAERITVRHGDGVDVLKRLGRGDVDDELAEFVGADVVCIDPMFPLSCKGRAAERKAMKVLRRVVGDDDDAGDLLRAGLGVAERRVVVKRPLRGEGLTVDGAEVGIVQKGKGFRFDIYLKRLDNQVSKGGL